MGQSGASLWACSLAAAWSSCASGGARSSSGTSQERSTWPSAGRRRRSSKHASNKPGIVGLRALPWLPLLDQALRLHLHLVPLVHLALSWLLHLAPSAL